MLPLRDVIPSHSTPYITLTIIALTTAVWLAELSLPLASAADNFSRFGIVPARVTGWSLLTAPFLHASWIQVVCNMWSLWVFGENVEGRLGPVGFGVFYLLSSAVATLAYVLADPSSSLLVVGSSGAVAGERSGPARAWAIHGSWTRARPVIVPTRITNAAGAATRRRKDRAINPMRALTPNFGLSPTNATTR